VVHAKYDSHFVPRPIPFYRAISTFNYPVFERVGLPTLRTSTGVSQSDGGQTVISVYDVVYRGIISWFCCVRNPTGVKFFPYAFPIDSGEFTAKPWFTRHAGIVGQCKEPCLTWCVWGHIGHIKAILP